ncbi:MAG: hypothetical protein DRQ47_07610, partial [Gammaproteobacteria bacterium]
MHYLKILILLCFISLLIACDKSPELELPLADDYQRIDGALLTADEATLRKSTVSNIQYFLQIDLTKSERYSGIMEIRFDYKPTTFPLTIDFIDGEAERILVNSNAIAIDYVGNFINIPSANLDAGPNSIKIQFSHAYAKGESGLIRYVDPVDEHVYIFSQSSQFNGNKLFPSFDQPNLHGTYEVRVVTLKDWTVISSIKESEAIVDGPFKRWKFPESSSFSNHLFSLYAGPWQIWESMADNKELRLITRQSIANRVAVREWFRITQQGIKFFNDYFSRPYPYQKYDQILVPELAIDGIENFTTATFSEQFITDGLITASDIRASSVAILKQLSRTWFSNEVSMKWWDSSWLKEGFSSYMAPIALSKISDKNNEQLSFYSNIKLASHKADYLDTTGPINVPIYEISSSTVAIDSSRKNKAAVVFQQLAHFMGEKSFQQGIRSYLAKFRNQSTDVSDFIETMDAATSRNLNQWISTWFNLPGVNTLSADYQCDEGKISTFTVKQSAPEQSPFYRNHNLQIGLYNTDKQQVVSATSIIPVQISAQINEMDELVGLPCPLMVHLNHGDWGYVKVHLDVKTQLMLSKNISQVDNKLSRAMFWQSLWDMVLDQEFSLNDYLKLLNKSIAAESDLQLLSQILSTIEQANGWIRASHLVNDEAKNHLEELELLMLNQSLLVEDGSPLQLAWFDAFTGLAETKQGLNHLSNWLQGFAAPLKLANNQKMRWQALLKLQAS